MPLATHIFFRLFETFSLRSFVINYPNVFSVLFVINRIPIFKKLAESGHSLREALNQRERAKVELERRSRGKVTILIFGPI